MFNTGEAEGDEAVGGAAIGVGGGVGAELGGELGDGADGDAEAEAAGVGGVTVLNFVSPPQPVRSAASSKIRTKDSTFCIVSISPQV